MTSTQRVRFPSHFQVYLGPSNKWLFFNLVLHRKHSEVMSMKTNVFFSFPNKSTVMKDKD